MKNPLNKAIELAGVILSAGFRAWAVATIVEAILFVVALAVGLIVWFNKDFFTGLVTGFLVFVIGQILVMAVLDAMFMGPERDASKKRIPGDDEVIRSLGSELGAKPDKAREE